MKAPRFRTRAMLRHALPAGIVLAFAAGLPVQAHVTLENAAAPVGSYYKATFSVPHGCSGSATTAIKVRIPDGVVSVKPQPKPGWTLQTTDGDYAEPVALHGADLTRGVREVSWSGGKLPDAYFDEFTLLAYLAPTLKPGATLYFPLVQECEQGVQRWIDTSAAHSGNPAPALHLQPARSGH